MQKFQKIINFAFTGIKNELRFNFCNHRPKKMLYDHIPKCGGTTFTDLLRQNYIYRRSYNVNRGSQQARVDQFQTWEEAKRNKIDLIYGHRANQLFDYCSSDMRMVTILRDPADRLISHYYFVKSTPGHYLHSAVQKNNLDLMEYLEGGISEELQNYYTIHFSGHPLDYVLRKPDIAIRDALKCISDRYYAVGFLDKIGVFVDLMCKEFLLKPPETVPKTNITKIKPATIPGDIIERIRNKNAIDYTLYEEIKKVMRCDF